MGIKIMSNAFAGVGSSPNNSPSLKTTAKVMREFIEKAEKVPVAEPFDVTADWGTAMLGKVLWF